MVKRSILPSRRVAAAMLALLPMGLVAGAGVAAAQALVVKASGPSAPQFPAGRKLAAGAAVKLAAGDMVVLLDNGGTRVLQGPGNFPVAASTTQVAANSGVVALLSARRTGMARTGAVRGVEEDNGPARSPNLWYVDVSRSQTVCEPDFGSVRLWRPDIASAGRLTIKSAAGGAAVDVDMAQGQAAAAWPAALPISDGARFTVTGAGLAQPVELRFARVDAPAEQADAVASTLIGHGCSVQLDLLLANVPARDGGATSS